MIPHLLNSIMALFWFWLASGAFNWITVYGISAGSDPMEFADVAITVTIALVLGPIPLLRFFLL